MIQSNTYIWRPDMRDYVYHVSMYISQNTYLYMSVKVKDHMPAFTW